MHAERSNSPRKDDESVANGSFAAFIGSKLHLAGVCAARKKGETGGAMILIDTLGWSKFDYVSCESTGKCTGARQ